MYKALVMVEHGKPMPIQMRKIPRAPNNGLVVKVKAAGLCHSDVHIWRGTYHVVEGKTTTIEELEPNFSLPVVLCHEIAGEVTEVGSQAGSDVQVGDRVVVYTWVGCTVCDHCAVELDNHCNKSFGNNYGVCRDGGFQEYLAVADSSRVVKLPDNIAMDKACLLGCSALTAYHALTRLRPTVERSFELYGSASIVIVGTGGLGLWGLRLSRFVLPKGTKVFQADISEEKLKLAKKNGADGTILWDKSETSAQIVAKTQKVVGGEINGGIDFVGHNTTLERLYEASKNGSTVVCVGLAGGVMHLSTTKSLLKNINLSFVYVGSMPQQREVIELVGKHNIASPPITHYKLEDVNGLIPKLADGQIEGRAVVMFD